MKGALQRYGVKLERDRKWAELFRQRYEDTGNPLALWDCYIPARKSGEPVPEFVLEYLDRAAAALLNTDNDIKAVGRCLELNVGKTNKGGHSAFTQYGDHLTRRQAVFAVYQELEDHPGLKVDDACAKVANRLRLPVDGGAVLKWYSQTKL